MSTNSIDSQSWKKDLPAFREQTEAFYAGKLDKNAYKGFSGLYGSYAQKGGTASMLRLRMTAGQMTKEKMIFLADAIRRYQVPRLHFTTCQTTQFHDLHTDAVCGIMEEALDYDIVTMGGGGDFPRNVMCSPLSGVEEGEYFDVMPYARAAADYLMTFIKAEKMPRKLKVGFSNSPANLTHATFRDLGFAAREDGTFDVYCAGGLGNNPKFGIKVADGIEPSRILYYIKAMWLTFRAYGNYENRGKARTRYMVEALGGEDNYKKAYNEKLEEVLASGENLTISVKTTPVTKAGGDTRISGRRIIAQKQTGLYTVIWHPIGGNPAPETFCALSDFLAEILETEIRLAPDETAYIINLTGEEAEKVLALTEDSAASLFESSVSCIGAATCQIGVRDSQGLLLACVKAVREANLPDGALPRIHISGCPSSCGTHQIGTMGFRGGVKMVGGKAQPAFVFFLGGKNRQGEEAMGEELGAMLEEQIPEFLVTLGTTVAASGKPFGCWCAEEPEGVKRIAAPYLK